MEMITNKEKIMSKTILKWAGNKSRVMPAIISHFPKDFNAYVEPFAGALGAYLNSGIDIIKHPIHLNDVNAEIINLYECIRLDSQRVLNIANALKRDEASFYNIRSWDKQPDWKQNYDKWQQAARTLYLNKQSYNGLYRINKKGQYNTPYCQQEKIGDLIDNKTLTDFLSMIQNVNFYNEDFNKFLLRDFGKNALYYLDPPYVDINNPERPFDGYQCSFGLKEQESIVQHMSRLSSNGHKVIVSNSYCPKTVQLYQGFSQHIIQAPRSISSKASSRGMINEILVIT